MANQIQDYTRKIRFIQTAFNTPTDKMKTAILKSRIIHMTNGYSDHLAIKC